MKRILALLLAGVMTIGMLSGCGNKAEEAPAAEVETEAAQPEAEAEEAAPAEKHINLGLKGSADTVADLRPHSSGWTATRWGVGERLFRVNDEIQVEPWLAESYEQIDELTWKITLRDGISYTSGKAMDGESVKACLEYIIANDAAAETKLNIASIEAEGQVLTITTNAINAALIYNMTDLVTTIMDVDTLDKEGVIPAGTGPFICTEIAPGSAELVANENYWNGDVKVDSISITYYADGNAQAMALDNGEVDLTFQLPTENMEQFIGKEGFTVSEVVGSRSQILFFDHSNELLQDINVRNAICMAIDREGYANGINKGHSVAATAVFPVSYTYGDVPGVSFDLEAAAELLAEAGYADSNGDGTLDKDGKELNFKIYTYGGHGALLPTYAEAIQAALKTIGIGITINLNEWSAHSDITRQPGYDLCLESFIMSATGDPQYLVDQMLRSGEAYNVSRYESAEMDALIEELDNEFDQERRYELAREIQKLVVEDCAMFTLGHLKYSIVSSDKVTGYSTNPCEYYILTENLEIVE